MYHIFKVTGLTKVELGARDLAWRSSLKQCCSVWHKEQLWFLGLWLNQLLTCVNLDFKNQRNQPFQHLANFAKSWTLTAWQANLEHDFSLFLLWFRTSALNKYCSWYIGLQFRFRKFWLEVHGLRVCSTWTCVVRLGVVHWNELIDVVSGRPPAEHARRVSAATAARRQRSDRASHAAPGHGLNPASACPSRPAPSFRFFRPLFLAAAAAELP